MRVKEVILDDTDVSKALIEYTRNNQITKMVVGSSNRNAITRKFKNTDVPTLLLKSASDFCTVYVISKGKIQNVRTAKFQPQMTANYPIHYPSQGVMEVDDEYATTTKVAGFKAPIPNPNLNPNNRKLLSATTNYYGSRNMSYENLDMPLRTSNVSDEFNFEFQFQSDVDDTFQFSPLKASCSPLDTSSPQSNQRDMEAEMKRLKNELKQTMDMYSTACKEAITAKQVAKELEEAKKAEEEAVAVAKMANSRCKEAIEAAQKSKWIAEIESKKRIDAELATEHEHEEKKKVLEILKQKQTDRYRKYNIDEIQNATCHFSDCLKIGEGGYGPVYKATLDHTPVAIKVLRPDVEEGRKQFKQEVEVLSLIRHPNMVLLLGACPDYGCLIYEYMNFGSLDDRLFRRDNTPAISWITRFKIAADIATGLLFLHQTKPEPLVHRDLKPSNILLDKNYTSKISDVGLSRLVPPSVVDGVTQYRMTSTAGTFCYIDPEYQQTGMLGTKSDIYSLGILLLQMITAKPPMGLTHHVQQSIDRNTFDEILDPEIKNWPMEEALSFAKLALRCAELRRKDRPDLRTEILPELARLRSFGQKWEYSTRTKRVGK